MNALLAFIKAYRLRGDVESLKKSVIDRFSSDDVEAAKKLLWDHCEHDLLSAGLLFHSRRDSDKRSSLAANWDDILQAFDFLDSSDLIPHILCVALDLLTIPSLSPDPVSDKIHYDTISLRNLVSLESKFPTFLNSVSTGSHGGTYASAVSSSVPLPPKSPPSQIQSRSASRSPVQRDTRDSNIIILGLPESGSIVETKSTVDKVLEFLLENLFPLVMCSG